MPVIFSPSAGFGNMPLYGRYRFVHREKLDFAGDLIFVLPVDTAFEQRSPSKGDDAGVIIVEGLANAAVLGPKLAAGAAIIVIDSAIVVIDSAVVVIDSAIIVIDSAVVVIDSAVVVIDSAIIVADVCSRIGGLNERIQTHLAASEQQDRRHRDPQPPHDHLRCTSKPSPACPASSPSEPSSISPAETTARGSSAPSSP